MNTINYINASLELFSCVIAAIVALCLIFGRQIRSKSGRLYLRMLACNAGSQFFDTLALYFRGKIAVTSWWGVRISNFTSYALNYLLILVFIQYMTEYVRERTESSEGYVKAAGAVCGASLLLLIVTQYVPVYYYFDVQNMYHRASLFWVSQVGGLLCMVICALFLLRYGKYLNKTEKTGFWTYILLPMAALVVQIFSYGLVLVNLANTISLTLIFLFLQTELGRREAEQQKQLIEQENQLTQSRMAIMQSQINPHFIYNTLGTIHHFCKTDPGQAAYLIREFELYLRGNFGELEAKRPIMILKEMEHVKHYIEIEHVRFPDIRVEFDLKEKNFMLPALSVQPLVENAIRHGLMGRDSGGTVKVSTYHTRTSYCVRVEDDGMGFDPNEKCESDHPHIGIPNIRTRLALLCGGTLTVTSEKGKGTTALITIPKGDME